MQSLGNKKMWIVFNTQHSNFNDCPPKCMYTILYIVYLRWAVTIPCMFIAWNPFLHTKKPAHHLQTFRWLESVFCQWYELRWGSLPPLRNPPWSEEFPLAPSERWYCQDCHLGHRQLILLNEGLEIQWMSAASDWKSPLERTFRVANTCKN